MLAERLGKALAQYGLGQATPEPAEAGETAVAPLVLRAPPGNTELVQRLLVSLSPYIAGEAIVVLDRNLDIDDMSLTVAGDPRFTPDGVAIMGTALEER